MPRSATGPLARRVAYGVAAAIVYMVAGSALVWWLGFTLPWAVAAVLVVGAVVAVLTTLSVPDESDWPADQPESVRGVRLVAATLSQAASACDRLAQPRLVRHIRALFVSERDDRRARTLLVRRLRALLLAELRAHGWDPADPTQHDALRAQFGDDLLLLLQPEHDAQATVEAMHRCLDALDRLHTHPIAYR